MYEKLTLTNSIEIFSYKNKLKSKILLVFVSKYCSLQFFLFNAKANLSN